VALRKIVAGELAEPHTVRPDFPAALWKILQHAMAPRPEQRLQPASQLACALDGMAGLSQAQGRALLSSTMRRLFPDEMGAEASDIAELRRLSRSAEAATTVQGHAVTRVTSERPGPRLSVVAWALGFVAVGGAAAVLLERPGPAASAAPAELASAVAPAGSVELSLHVSPPNLAALQLFIGGVPVSPAAPHRLVARGSEPLLVRVAAPGYRSVELPVVPDRERALVVTLAPESAAAAAPTSAPAKAAAVHGPAPVASGVIRRYPF
jgi:hypothetical protein